MPPGVNATGCTAFRKYRKHSQRKEKEEYPGDYKDFIKSCEDIWNKEMICPNRPATRQTLSQYQSNNNHNKAATRANSQQFNAKVPTPKQPTGIASSHNEKDDANSSAEMQDNDDDMEVDDEFFPISNNLDDDDNCEAQDDNGSHNLHNQGSTNIHQKSIQERNNDTRKSSFLLEEFSEDGCEDEGDESTTPKDCRRDPKNHSVPIGTEILEDNLTAFPPVNSETTVTDNQLEENEQPEENTVLYPMEEEEEFEHVAERDTNDSNMNDESTHPLSSELRDLISKTPNLGKIIEYPATHPRYNQYEDKMTRSMIRLIDFCDNNCSTNRTFLDRFLKILDHEINQNGFRPGLAPSRESVATKIKNKYGNDGHPQIGRFKLSSIHDPYQILLSDHNALHSRSRDAMDVISFSLVKNTIDLYEDRSIFGNTKNLVVNPANPFEPYQGTCDEILGGEWWRSTIRRLMLLKKNPLDTAYHFPQAYVLYVDKTGTTDNQRFPLEPVIFTLAIIRRELRNNHRAWRPLGFIPDIETKSTFEAQYIRKKNRSATSQSYHRYLEFILHGFAKVQETGFVHWLRLGDHVKKVLIRPEIAFIIGDGKSADMLTTRYGGNVKNTARISRACYTSQTTCDNVMSECRYVKLQDRIGAQHGNTTNNSTHSSHNTAEGVEATEKLIRDPASQPDTLACLYKLAGSRQDEVAEFTAAQGNTFDEASTRASYQGLLSPQEMNKRVQEARMECAQVRITEAQEKLRQAGFHPVRNAFMASCIRFGFDPRGVWGANPTDMMHAFQSGLVMYATLLTMGKLGPMLKGRLDDLVDRMLGCLRSSEKPRYPRYSFVKGFSRVSNITSDEWVGKLFVLYLVCSTHKGREIFVNRFDGDIVALSEEFRTMDMLGQATEFFQQAQQLDKKAEDDQKKKRKKRKKGAQDDEEDDDMDDEGDQQKDDQDPHVSKSKVDTEVPLRHCNLDDFIELCEALLCFHSWYKLDMHEWFCQKNNQDPNIRYQRLMGTIKRLLAMLKCYMPRASGNKWKIQKFHDMLHFAMDVFRFGNAKNFDAGFLESSLRYWAKFASQTAQTIGYNGFTGQVGARLYEFQCFAKARRELNIVGVEDVRFPSLLEQRKQQQAENGPTKKVQATVGGSHFRVYTAPFDDKGIPVPGGVCRPTEWIKTGGKERKSQMQLPPMVEEYLRHQHPTWERMTVGPNQYVDYWDVYTECCFSPPEMTERCPNKYPEGMNIRASPDYNARGPWFDWVMLEYNTEDHIFPYGGHPDDPLTEQEGTATRFYPVRCHPCKVLGFFLSKPPAEAQPDPEVGAPAAGQINQQQQPATKIHAIVHECSYQSKEQVQRGTTLLEEWSLEFEPKKVITFDHEKGKPKITKIPGIEVPRVAAVDINSIYDRCFVMEEEPGLKSELRSDGTDWTTVFDNNKNKIKVWKESCKTVHLVRDRSEWGRQFIDGWDDDKPGYLQR